MYSGKRYCERDVGVQFNRTQRTCMCSFNELTAADVRAHTGAHAECTAELGCCQGTWRNVHERAKHCPVCQLSIYVGPIVRLLAGRVVVWKSSCYKG